MNAKIVLRIISGVMLIAAIVFLAVALNHPEMGTVFYIGGLRIGVAVWRAFYLIYTVTMIALFGISFAVGKHKRSGD